jgi:hypothetical protein
VTLTAPSGTSAPSWSGSVGAAAAASMHSPKPAAEPTSSRGPAVPRAPAASAPPTEPTAMTPVSSA